MRKIVRVTSIHFVTYQQNNNPPSYLRRRSHGYCKVDGATYFATQVGGGGAFTTTKRHAGKYIGGINTRVCDLFKEAQQVRLASCSLTKMMLLDGKEVVADFLETTTNDKTLLINCWW